MKNLKLFIASLALVFAVQVSASTEDPVRPSEQLRSELIDLIGPNCPFQLDKNECTAEVLFTVNSAGEVIVISILSENSDAEKHVKNKINYKKVSHRPSKPGEIYLLPVRVVRS
jgi:hypothetical protein